MELNENEKNQIIEIKEIYKNYYFERKNRTITPYEFITENDKPKYRIDMITEQTINENDTEREIFKKLFFNIWVKFLTFTTDRQNINKYLLILSFLDCSKIFLKKLIIISFNFYFNFETILKGCVIEYRNEFYYINRVYCDSFDGCKLNFKKTNYFKYIDVNKNGELQNFKIKYKNFPICKNPYDKIIYSI